MRSERETRDTICWIEDTMRVRDLEPATRQMMLAVQLALEWAIGDRDMVLDDDATGRLLNAGNPKESEIVNEENGGCEG